MKPYSHFFGKLGCNCVLFARSKVPSLPYGLWTLADKKKIINSSKPKVGNVAIMAVGAFGHVGVVTYVGQHHITIQEANYYTCRLSERHGEAKSFKIVGYFKPKR